LVRLMFYFTMFYDIVIQLICLGMKTVIFLNVAFFISSLYNSG